MAGRNRRSSRAQDYTTNVDYRADIWNEIANLYGGDATPEFINQMSDGGWNDRKGAMAANYLQGMQLQTEMNYNTEMSNTQYQRGVADMQAAGVNPALMYGRGSTTTSPQVSMGTPQAAGTNSAAKLGAIFGGLGSIGQFASLIANASLAGAQKRNIDADTQEKLARAEGERIANRYAPEQIEANISAIKAATEKTAVEKDKALEEINLIRKQEDTEGYKAALTEAQISTEQARSMTQWLQVYYDSTTMKDRQRIVSLQGKLLEAQEALAKAQETKTYSDVAVNSKLIEKYAAEINNLLAQNSKLNAETHKLQNENLFGDYAVEKKELFTALMITEPFMKMYSDYASEFDRYYNSDDVKKPSIAWNQYKKMYHSIMELSKGLNGGFGK